jgi:hypothetical protein
MIEGIAGMPDGTFGLRVWGEVTRDDYVHGVLDPLREAIGRGESIRLLFQVGPGFEKFTAGLLAADATQGAALGLGHLSAGSAPRSSPTSSGYAAARSCSAG